VKKDFLVLTLLAGVLLTPAARAQTVPPPKPWLTTLDLTAGYGRTLGLFRKDRPAAGVFSAAYWHFWRLGRSGRVQLGLGGRLSHYRTRYGSYNLTSRLPTPYQPKDLGQEILPAFVMVSQPRLTAANFGVHARVRLTAREYGAWYLGFNLDLLGVSFGPDREDPSWKEPIERAPFNLLLVNRNDRGTLNSEFYVAYQPSPRLSLRAGLAHVATGYRFADERFQAFTNLGFAGVSYGVGGGQK
jgi:hypothetical protein